MFASEEWEELHLAPEDWKDDNYRHVPGGPVMIGPPVNDMLTVRRHVAVAYGGPSCVTGDRTPRTDNIGQIEQLLLRYGVPVLGVQSKGDTAECVTAQCLGASPSACAIFSPRDLREELA